MHTNVNNIISKLKDIDDKISNINNFEIVNEKIEQIESNQPCEISIDNMEDGVNIVYSDNTFLSFLKIVEKKTI